MRSATVGLLFVGFTLLAVGCLDLPGTSDTGGESDADTVRSDLDTRESNLDTRDGRLDTGDAHDGDSQSADTADSDALGDDTDIGPVDPTSFDEKVRREAFCSHVPACESKVGLVDFLERFCHPEATRRPAFFGVDSSAEGTRYEFDEQKARECLRAWKNAPVCEGYVAIMTGRTILSEPPCSEVFDGKQIEGEACIDSAECKDGFQCITDKSCPGECRSRPEADESCSGATDCKPGLYCNDSDVCKPRKGRGETCNETAKCKSDLYCDSDGTCVPEPSGEGDTCRRENGRDNCPGKLVCRGGVCTSGSPTGDSCSQNLPCKPGNRCVQGTCWEIVGPGASCRGSKTCILSHYCKSGTCVPRPTAGEKCSSPSTYWQGPARQLCYEGTCRNGTCELAEPGDQCSRGTYSERNCKNSYCGFQSAKCEPIKSRGDSCTQTRECPNNLVCRSDGAGANRCLPDC